MKTLTFEEAQQVYEGVNRTELIATARAAGANISDDAHIWFEEYTAEELAAQNPTRFNIKGVRLGGTSAFVEVKPN